MRAVATQPGSIGILDEDAVITDRDFFGGSGEFVALVGVLPVEGGFFVIADEGDGE